MSMPVSTRTDRSPGGNAFTPTRVLVPLTADPGPASPRSTSGSRVTKAERALGLTASLAGLVNLLPQPMLVRLARQQVLTVDFATSNVRAAPFDLYIAGALMTGNFPLGPIAGTAWNLTTMSYRGRLNLGLHVDRAAVEDPDQLRDDIADVVRRAAWPLVEAEAATRRGPEPSGARRTRPADAVGLDARGDGDGGGRSGGQQEPQVQEQVCHLIGGDQRSVLHGP